MNRSLFKVNRWPGYVAIFLLIAILATGFIASLEYVSFAVEDANKPQTDAVSAVLFDARRGQVMFSKTSDELTYSPLANRIVLALIVLEKTDTEAMVIASKDAANTEGATLKLTVGEKYAIKNLLTASLLTGSPDATKALAEYVGGSEADFVELMNEFTTNLGMKNTRFTDSIGTYNEEQHTTIDDMVILMKYALSSNSSFNRFFGTEVKAWYDDQKTLLLRNTNNMFWSYPGTDGGITAGHDTEFQSIITTATKNNMRLVCILLDVPTKAMYNDSINILNYGFDNYLYGSLVAAGSSQQAITVEGQSLNLIVASDVYYVFPKGQDYIRDVTINVDETKLKPPITKNTIVGMLTYVLEDETVINVDLYPDREILPQKTKQQIMRERLTESQELIFVIMGLILLEIIIGSVKLYGYIKKKFIKSKLKRTHGRTTNRGRRENMN